MKSALMALLEVKNLRVSYIGREPVLKNVSFSVDRGENVLIIGRSGSGKTTLARALIGLLQKSNNVKIEGEILFKGKRLEDYTNDEISANIKLIGQNPYVYFIEHIVESDLTGYMSRFTDWKKAREIVYDKSRLFELEHLLKRYYYTLSGGEAKRAAILKAALMPPELLILDEPLMWVDDDNTYRLVNLLLSLKSLGISSIVLEHRFIPLLNVVDRVLLLDEGSIKPIHKECLLSNVRLQVREEIRDRIAHKARESRELLVSLNNVDFHYDDHSLFEGLNLEVTKGEVILIVGRNGSGKTTLLKLIAGYLKPRNGKVIYRDRHNVAYMPQRPMSFFTEMTIGREIGEICKRSPEPTSCVNRIKSFLYNNGISDMSNSPFTLSWGQQVRLALALISLSRAYRLILLDEPFTGLDYSERCEIGNMISKIVNDERGELTAIVALSSSETALCIEADRIYRIEARKLVSDAGWKDKFHYSTELHRNIKDIYQGRCVCSES